MKLPYRVSAITRDKSYVSHIVWAHSLSDALTRKYDDEQFSFITEIKLSYENLKDNELLYKNLPSLFNAEIKEN